MEQLSSACCGPGIVLGMGYTKRPKREDCCAGVCVPEGVGEARKGETVSRGRELEGGRRSALPAELWILSVKEGI